MASVSIKSGGAPANTPSRRAFMGGALAAPALALVTSPALATPLADRMAWDQSMRDYERAQAAREAFDRNYSTPAYEAWMEACDKVSHVHSPGYQGHGHYPLSTDDRGSLALARKVASAGANADDASDAYWPDFAKECRRIATAADARDAECARLNHAFKVDALADQSEALWAAASAAEYRLMQMPAPDARALAWKLERILTWDQDEEFSTGWSRDYAGSALEDARRLGRAG